MRLIPAQYVKPFLKGHKNDYRDAEAIAAPVAELVFTTIYEVWAVLMGATMKDDPRYNLVDCLKPFRSHPASRIRAGLKNLNRTISGVSA